MKIAFVYSEGRESRLSAAAAGELPTDFFYGAMELAKAGHEITYSQVSNKAGQRLGSWLDGLFGKWMPARFRISNLFAAHPGLARWNDADCIVAANSQVGMSLGLWKRLGGLRTPLVAIHCGIVNWKHGAWRLKISRPIFAEQEVVLFADTEAREMMDAFSIPRDRIHVCPYGVDVEFWHPAKVPPAFVFAVGNDGRRDFDVLAKAAATVDFPHRLLSRLQLAVPAPSNLEHITGHWSNSAVDDATLRSWYQSSLCVVIPLAETIQPSGQSVALQAMACGRPVIMTRTAGYWLHPDFKDGEHVITVQPGDVAGLAEAVNRLVREPLLADTIGAAGRALMLKHYSIEKFAHDIEAVCLHAAGRHS